MTRGLVKQVVRIVLGLAVAGAAVPAQAERLSFDHRLVPQLKAVLDGGDAAMVDFDNSNPRNVVDLIVVRGKSTKDWREALVIIARTPDAKVKSAADWMEELRGEAAARCQVALTTIESDQASATFERHAESCPGSYPRNAIYRAVAGAQSLFLLAVLSRDELAQASRDEWLALLKSAHIE